MEHQDRAIRAQDGIQRQNLAELVWKAERRHLLAHLRAERLDIDLGSRVHGVTRATQHNSGKSERTNGSSVCSLFHSGAIVGGATTTRKRKPFQSTCFAEKLLAPQTTDRASQQS